MNRLEEELMHYNNTILFTENYLENKKRIRYEDWRYLHDFLDFLRESRSGLLKQIKMECE